MLCHGLVELCALLVSSGIQHMRLRLCFCMSLTLLHTMYVVVLLIYASHTSTYYIDSSRTHVSQCLDLLIHICVLLLHYTPLHTIYVSHITRHRCHKRVSRRSLSSIFFSLRWVPSISGDNFLNITAF